MPVPPDLPPRLPPQGPPHPPPSPLPDLAQDPPRDPLCLALRAPLVPLPLPGVLAAACLLVALPLAAALDAALAGAVGSARGALWVATAGAALFACAWVGTRPRRGARIALDADGVWLPRLGSARRMRAFAWPEIRALSRTGRGVTTRHVLEVRGRTPRSLPRAGFADPADFEALPDRLAEAVATHLGVEAAARFAQSSAFCARHARARLRVTVGLLALLAAAFAAQLAWLPLPGGSDWIDLGGASWPLIVGGQFDRLYTSALLHASASHFLFNTAALWGLGWSLERWLGSLRTGALLALVTPLAALVGAWAEPGRVYLGSSALTYALLGVWAGLLLRARPLPAPLAVPAWTAVALAALLVWDLLVDLRAGGTGATTAWSAHTLAAAIGAAVGLAGPGDTRAGALGDTRVGALGGAGRVLATAALAAAAVALGQGLHRVATTAPEQRLAAIERVLRAGRGSAALRLRLSAAIAEHPDSDSDQLRRARDELEGLARVGARHAELWRGLLRARERLGDWDAAVEAAITGQRAAPRSRRWLRELARIERARLEQRPHATSSGPAIRLGSTSLRDSVAIELRWRGAAPDGPFVLHALLPGPGPGRDTHLLEFAGRADSPALRRCRVDRGAPISLAGARPETSWFRAAGPVQPFCRLRALPR